MFQLFFQHLRFVALFWPHGLPPGIMVALGKRSSTGLGLTGEANVVRRSTSTAQQTAVGLSTSQRMMRFKEALLANVLKTREASNIILEYVIYRHGIT